MVLFNGSLFLIVLPGIFGILFAFSLWSIIAKIPLASSYTENLFGVGLLADTEEFQHSMEILTKCYNMITNGARAFLRAQYTICLGFVCVFCVVILFLTGRQPDGWNFQFGLLSTISFAVGACTSILSGYIGMTVAVFSNARTALMAVKQGPQGWMDSFNTAFRAGGVMGFALCSLALVVLYLLIVIYQLFFYTADSAASNVKLYEALAGYGLGGSSMALFGRVGGGIYTKAADVGADLAGKVVAGIPEDDPRNPATIADNVGDNVGDVAGMGSDLFGSFAEATCAALVIATQSDELCLRDESMLLPLYISGVGILCCAITSFIATDLYPVTKEADVEKVLKMQILSSTLLMSIACYPLFMFALPTRFSFKNFTDELGDRVICTKMGAYACVLCGLWSGCIIGFVTEYYTSNTYRPVQEVAKSCETGASTNIIYGLALGMKSAIIPILLLAFTVYNSFKNAGMYGVALAALGMLGTLATCLTIDVYGPVCDNAGGIAEMAGFPTEVREKTDSLDAAGNTTAAIGKGFAIGSAVLVSLALFGAFMSRVSTHSASHEMVDIEILSPMTFAMLFVGAMLPYWFTAMCMKSVGTAAMEMVKEVKRQFDTIPGLLEGLPGYKDPDPEKCVMIATNAALRTMIAPALLVMITPILVGFLFGIEAVAGLLVGSLTSGVQLAIFQANAGGAWDNAKKYVEKGRLAFRGQVQGKGSEAHKASVIGDTVGDPLKDTSGPALNILMKLMAIISLVFADFFVSIHCGQGLLYTSASILTCRV